MEGNFHNTLKHLINDYILLGYKISKKFPKDEQYGMTSQARRALLSIMLNYVEGYGRTKRKVTLNQYEISFGSLKESIYVFYLAHRISIISEQEYMELFQLKERIAQMLWKTIEGIKKNINDLDE